MVENGYEISGIQIKSTAKCYCPLGKDWYTNNFEIHFLPDRSIPDYCELDKWIEKNINGQELIIEAAVDMLHTYLKDTYKPINVTVESHVTDARHSEVMVYK